MFGEILLIRHAKQGNACVEGWYNRFIHQEIGIRGFSQTYTDSKRQIFISVFQKYFVK